MVLNGLDHLADAAPWLKGRRLGLITSTSGVTRMLTSGIDAIHAQFPLTALFGPEHGVRGDHDAGATVETYTDPTTRLPVYSLYRKDSQHMTPEMLDLVDTVIYDIQDIGARFYTYISTLLYVMRDCAAAGKELVVLDRINPLGGKVEGGLLQPGFESFVGAYPLTTRYGLTPGEFARLANEEQHIGCQLHVLPVLGWKREMLFPETGLYWMMPSPAIPNFETALLYPGTCLTEATNISEGRGTSAPFELIGAPFINGAALADRMNAKKLPGVIFTAAYFTPSASKHAGRRCEGVHIHLTDTKAYDTIRTGTALLYAIREIYPNDFALRQPEDEKALLPINRLTGSDVLAHDWPPPCRGRPPPPPYCRWAYHHYGAGSCRRARKRPWRYALSPCHRTPHGLRWESSGARRGRARHRGRARGNGRRSGAFHLWRGRLHAWLPLLRACRSTNRHDRSQSSCR